MKRSMGHGKNSYSNDLKSQSVAAECNPECQPECHPEFHPECKDQLDIQYWQLKFEQGSPIN